MNLKEHFDWALVHDVAERMTQTTPDFDADEFVNSLPYDFSPFEMKERIYLISEALYNACHRPYSKALPKLLTALEAHGNKEALTGFPVWLVTDIIERHGLDDPELSLTAIHNITQKFTGEFAIRSYLQHHPKLTLSRMHEWTDDVSHHVRRLASEGIRPKLPWGKKVDWLVAEPTKILEVLDKLYQDDSEYVRRSVANNLNDISKTHPDLMINHLKTWQQKHPSTQLNGLIRHACRHLVKTGHPQALALQGFKKPDNIEVMSFSISPKTVLIGNDITVVARLKNMSTQPCNTLIDVILHSTTKTGKPRQRVLKWSRLQLDAQQNKELTKQWAIKDTSTRTETAGLCHLDLMVNGIKMAQADFQLIDTQQVWV